RARLSSLSWVLVVFASSPMSSFWSKFCAGVARLSLQEVTDAFRDFAGMRFQGEVAGVEEANNRARIVALESLGARRQEEWVVPAPHRQEGRLVRAEVFLE